MFAFFFCSFTVIHLSLHLQGTQNFCDITPHHRIISSTRFEEMFHRHLQRLTRSGEPITQITQRCSAIFQQNTVNTPNTRCAIYSLLSRASDTRPHYTNGSGTFFFLCFPSPSVITCKHNAPVNNTTFICIYNCTYVRATCLDLVGHPQALQENRSKSFDILLTVRLNIFILILTNLMH